MNKIIVLWCTIFFNFSPAISMQDNPGAGEDNVGPGKGALTKSPKDPMGVKRERNDRIIQWADEITEEQKAKLLLNLENLKNSVLKKINQ